MADLSSPPPGWLPPAAPRRPLAVPANRKRFDNRRVIAYLVDCVLLLGACFGLGADLTAPSDVSFTWLSGAGTSYFLLCEALCGQTAGKRLLGLRVVSADGRAAGAGQVLVRTVLRVVDGLLLLGLIVMLATGPRRQRIGDLAAGTVVVAADPDPGRAARSPWVLLAGALWAAVCVTLAFAAGPSYAEQMQTFCRDRRAALASAGRDPARLLAAEQQSVEALARISPPPERAGAHREVLALEQSTLSAWRYIAGAAARGERPRGAAFEPIETYVARAPALYAAVGMRC